MTSVWWEAARPRTLPAAVAPVLVGTAAADRSVGELIWWRAGVALAVALALQVAVNYANDWFDAVGGVDNPDRAGPRRAVAAGLVSPAAMRTATAVALGIASGLGLALVAAAGWELLVVGLAAVAATLGYSGGSRPYASAGLGEVFVFVFFGLVATVGSQYVQDERWSWLALLAALPIGCLVTAILVVNNLRDIPTDAAAGKRTLAVRLGEARTRNLYGGLVVAAFALLVPLAVAAREALVLLPMVTAPLAARTVRRVATAPLGRDLVAALESTGRLHLLLGGLLAVGLALRPHAPVLA